MNSRVLSADAYRFTSTSGLVGGSASRHGEMLKWFNSSDGPTSQSRSSQVGRTYHVGDHHLIVQDVIAEGTLNMVGGS